MTDEDSFQLLLDQNPKAWEVRLVFADWLEEHGDPRAAGYRWLGGNKRRPRCPTGVRWHYLHDYSCHGAHVEWGEKPYGEWPLDHFCDHHPFWNDCIVPCDLIAAANNAVAANDDSIFFSMRSRREIEDAMALAVPIWEAQCAKPS